MLNDPLSKGVRWSESGMTIELQLTTSFCKTLSKFFTTKSHLSFIRQLNAYGFIKRSCRLTDVCTFEHKYFVRDKPDWLHHITRRGIVRLPNTDRMERKQRVLVKQTQKVMDKQTRHTDVQLKNYKAYCASQESLCVQEQDVLFLCAHLLLNVL